MTINNKQKQGFVPIIIILAMVAAIGIGGYYLRKQNQPSPSSITTATNMIDNWKTYSFQGGLFKYPPGWNENPVLTRGSGFTQEIKNKEGPYILTFSTQGNYSQLTGKPYATLEEFIGPPPNILETLTIDGQQGGRILPRAGSENKSAVVFFSKDKKDIYTLELDTGSSTLTDAQITKESVKTGQELFNRILSTFKFVAPAKSINTSSWTVYVNKTYSYSIKFPTTYEVKPGTEEQNTCVRTKSGDGKCVVLINVYDNKNNLTLQDYLNKNLISFGITGSLVSYSFNGYDSLFNKNQPGTNVFVNHDVNVYRIIASAASSNKEIGDIVATFRFMSTLNYGPQKVAVVLVQDGSNYGPPFDSNLYQLEISKSKHLFAKSDLVDLKKYLGKNIKVHYREVKGVIMGEQQLVIVDFVE